MKKNSPPHFMLRALVLLVFVAMLPLSSLADDKLKADEIVAKSLEAVGPAEARAKIQSRIAGGSVVATFLTPASQFKGRAVMASEGSKNLIAMDFNNTNYAMESLGFDGQEVWVGNARAGVRSNLGDVVWNYRPVLKAGILGGVLSQSWPLFNLAESKAKISGGGTKKVGDKSAYVVRLIPRGGSDFEISLFFDAATFQHIRTEYIHSILPQLGATVNDSASQRPTRYKMVEEFSDFQKEGDLTLPHVYKISLELDTKSPFRGNWELTLDQFGFNQPIPPTMFNPTAKS